MAERDFVQKLKRVGFGDISIPERNPFGLEDAEMSPLFTEDLVALIRRLMSPEKQRQIGTAIVLSARLAR
jgi:arsenite methyltransferase